MTELESLYYLVRAKFKELILRYFYDMNGVI